MSESKIFTFSVPDYEKAKLAVITDIKQQCKQTGQSFSHVCIEALIKYHEEKSNGSIK